MRPRLISQPSGHYQLPIPTTDSVSNTPSTQSTLARSITHCFFVLIFYSLLFATFFSPVIFFNYLLAPADGIIQSVPNFYSNKVLWDKLILSGFPMTADPSVMTWYPLSLIFSQLPDAWNIFVLSAYVLMSSFTYGYVYTLTRCRRAATISGIVYGMSGFMMAHLGHTTIIHSAVWMPLIIWSLEKLRHELQGRWFAVCSLAVACGALAGHAQVLVYALFVGGAYVIMVGWTAPSGRWRYYGLSLLSVMIGVGLAAVQLLPTAELSALSSRAQLTFSDFVVFSLPITHIPLLLFPQLFGGTPGYGTSYFGEPNLTELTCYIGVLPLMLTVIGVVALKWKSWSLFWVGVALFAFLLALGDATVLAQFTYRIPVLNLFRAPARHFLELSLAVSVLSGLGVAAIVNGTVTRSLVSGVILSVAATMLACLLPFLLFPSYLSGLTAKLNVASLDLRPWHNPAVGVPLVMLLLAALALTGWHRKQSSSVMGGMLFCVLIADLASFGWFYEWREYAPHSEVLTPPTYAHKYKEELASSHQRILPVRGGAGTLDELPPLLSRLWGIPSASGYGPLSLSRVSNLASLTPHGSVGDDWKSSIDRSLDLLSARYIVLLSDDSVGAVREAHGATWAAEDMRVSLGSGCGEPNPASLAIDLPSPLRATRVGVISALGCSTGLTDNDEVLRVTMVSVDGGTRTRSLSAGRDTSEWAYDCDDVRPQMKHRRADVFESFPAARVDQQCEGHAYLTTIPLDVKATDIKSLRFNWVGASGAISIRKVSLIDEEMGRSYPVRMLIGSGSDEARWRYVEDAGRARVYENLRALPRAWLATEALTMTPDDALRTIKSSTLPDGRPFDPRRTALIEAPSSLSLLPLLTEPEIAPPSDAAARVVSLSDTMMEVHTSSTRPSVLVTSDAYYPGWRVTVNGSPASLLRADYALRGVAVPAGQHIVRFIFRPESLHNGLMISSASLLALISFATLIRRRRTKG